MDLGPRGDFFKRKTAALYVVIPLCRATTVRKCNDFTFISFTQQVSLLQSLPWLRPYGNHHQEYYRAVIRECYLPTSGTGGVTGNKVSRFRPAWLPGSLPALMPTYQTFISILWWGHPSRKERKERQRWSRT